MSDGQAVVLATGSKTLDRRTMQHLLNMAAETRAPVSFDKRSGDEIGSLAARKQRTARGKRRLRGSSRHKAISYGSVSRDNFGSDCFEIGGANDVFFGRSHDLLSFIRADRGSMERSGLGLLSFSSSWHHREADKIVDDKSSPGVRQGSRTSSEKPLSIRQSAIEGKELGVSLEGVLHA